VTRVAIALGSNIEPAPRLMHAARLLRAAFPDIRFSSCYQNPAVGFEGADFINAAATLSTDGSVEALTQVLHHIEEQCGRRRDDAKWAPRAMDLDILLFGELVCATPGMRVPRPDLLRRAYMLGPLAELEPGLVHPLAGRALAALWQQLAPQSPPLARTALDLNVA
jgi:2-amino-4-hydroxy-6-hydroxymethyldihydropteridine diphosphokinase